MSELQVTFNEIRDILAGIPGPDRAAAAKAGLREKELTKPEGALGQLENLSAWYAAWRGNYPLKIDRPRVAVFAANHGVAAQGVSAYPQDVTKQMVANFQSGGAAVNQLCQVADAELRVYEMALEHPTADFTQEPAMSEAACAQAMAYGMMAVEDGIDVLCVGEMGIGNTTSAAAICCALFGGDAADWVGPGTGVPESGVSKKAEVVARAMALHSGAMTDPFDVLRCVGGLELAAITGAVLAARIARTPVILDGFACTAAAAVLYKMDHHALDHCIVGHCSAEPGHTKLLAAIEKPPMLNLGMRLGEASGATTALLLLRAAVACHTGMATFADASVSEKS